MRRMLRASRGWAGDGGEAEAAYIVSETKRAFRERRHLTDPGQVARALEEGEDRLEMALHYKIAYPRLPHLALSGGGDVKNVLPPAEKGSARGSWASHVGAKDVPPEVARMAATAAPVNPALNSARAAARAKRLAMSRATAAVTGEDDER